MKIHSNLALLITRVIIGGIFVAAGWMKIVDMANVVGFFETLGLAAYVAYIVSYAELLGGILIILGLWADIAAWVLGIIMLGAIYFSRSMGFAGVMGPLAVLAGLISIIGSGVGHYSVKMKMR